MNVLTKLSDNTKISSDLIVKKVNDKAKPVDYFQYSTSEQFTGHYWIDGKKIYCQTLKDDGNNVATARTISWNPSKLNEIVKFEGLAYNTSDNRIVSLPFADNASNLTISFLYETDNKRFVIYPNARLLNRFWITVYYTKTTD